MLIRNSEIKDIDVARRRVSSTSKGFQMSAPPTESRRNISLTRRVFATSLLCLPLAACDSENAVIRYRVIARITYEGHPYEASTVMECSYQRIRHSLIGNGASTRLRGEALIFDLPNKKSFYILPWARDRSGGLRQFYEFAIPKTLGIKRGIGSLRDDDMARLKSAAGEFPLFDKGGLPAFVAFDDEAKPNTIFEIAPSSNYPKFPGVRPIGEAFPGVRFDRMDIEITDAPITKKLGERLPWLNTNFHTEVFPRIRGNRAYDDTPIRYLVTTTHFFGL